MEKNKAFVVLIANLLFLIISAQASAHSWQAGTGFWDDANNWGGSIPGSSGDAIIDNSGEAVVRPFYKPNSVRLYATDDTYVKSNYPTQNNGNLDHFQCFHANFLNVHHLGYVKFNLSSIPDTAIISNVTLRLRVKGVGFCVLPEADVFYINKVVSDLWLEGLLTWGNKPDFGEQIFSYPSAELPISDEWLEVSVPIEMISQSITSDDMVSFGFSVSSSCGDGPSATVRFYPSESGYSPQLLVNYTEPTKAEAQRLSIANAIGSSGSASMAGGTLSLGDPGMEGCGQFEGNEGGGGLEVGFGGSGVFTQANGDVCISGRLTLGLMSEGQGTYNLSGGELSVSGYIGEFIEDPMDEFCGGMWEFMPGVVQVGLGGRGVFNHSGGKLFSDGDISGLGFDIFLTGNYAYDSVGEYNLSGTAELIASGIYLIGSGTAIFHQSGGINKSRNLSISVRSSSSAIYKISGGLLEVGGLRIGDYYSNFYKGSFEILNPASDIRLGGFNLYKGGSFKAVAGSKISFAPGSLKIQTTDSNAVSGLGNTEMFFESDEFMDFEVAGEDIGAIYPGFNKNFVLGTLRVGDVNAGQVRLVDDYDNQPGSAGSEALYVTNLILGSGSILDLNGLNLYYSYFTDLGATVITNGGNLLQVNSFAPGDFSENNQVDLYDFSILSNAWGSRPGDDNWNEKCDISEPIDNIIDELDLGVFVDNWLVGL